MKKSSASAKPQPAPSHRAARDDSRRTNESYVDVSRERLHGLRSGIVFTRVWEDHEVDRRALAVSPGARVVVIAGAGDRALDAVAWGAGEVTAVDLNPAQLRLAALKVAAAGMLESTDLIAMFSVGRRPGVARLYRHRLRPFLTSEERAYWDRFIGIFELGFHQHHPQGLRDVAGRLAAAPVGGRELRRVIAGAPDAATQARWYEGRLRGRYWNRLSRWLIGRSALMRWIVVHPGERELMRRQGFQGWLETAYLAGGGGRPGA